MPDNTAQQGRLMAFINSLKVRGGERPRADGGGERAGRGAVRGSTAVSERAIQVGLV